MQQLLMCMYGPPPSKAGIDQSSIHNLIPLLSLPLSFSLSIFPPYNLHPHSRKIQSCIVHCVIAWHLLLVFKCSAFLLLWPFFLHKNVKSRWTISNCGPQPRVHISVLPPLTHFTFGKSSLDPLCVYFCVCLCVCVPPGSLWAERPG